MNIGDVGMSDMTREEAIARARENYMNCYWDHQAVLSTLYNECAEREDGDLDEYDFGNC